MKVLIAGRYIERPLRERVLEAVWGPIFLPAVLWALWLGWGH